MILNRQRSVRIARRPLEEFLRRVASELGLAESSVTVCIVSEAEIARMNESYRGKQGPTDVLSFPAEARKKPMALRRKAAAGAATAYLGDIAISAATARRNAARFGRTFPAELRILILHGVLHLLGYDHETDRGQMDRAEAKLRRRLRLA
ncbi:MAG: rRNA maturation RNase YbeY [Acidobacteriia bacterium]|nr:rRNA maturation RNase YbeY [Terriglobia bacterium]